jgi:hypothetical protein
MARTIWYSPALLVGIFAGVTYVALTASPQASPKAETFKGNEASAKSSAEALQEEDWWAIRPLARPPLPQVKDTDWPVMPIDWFILAALESKSMTPAPPIDRLGRLHSPRHLRSARPAAHAARNR